MLDQSSSCLVKSSRSKYYGPPFVTDVSIHRKRKGSGYIIYGVIQPLPSICKDRDRDTDMDTDSDIHT